VIVLRFSDRYGFNPQKVVHLDGMSNNLRAGLWNEISFTCWEDMYESRIASEPDLHELFKSIWRNIFKKPVDEISKLWSGAHSDMKGYFFSIEWFQVYDLVEFIANNLDSEVASRRFKNSCNSIFEEERSGYRLLETT
jgi:hypothetical protein